eukprot:Skav209627  [mRNA]  locus=scaffold4224:14262:26961:+ [translate_table: standard]
MKIEQIEPPQQEILETPKVEMEPTDAESPPQPETVWSTQTPGEVLSLTAESTLESPAEGLPLSALEPRDMPSTAPARRPPHHRRVDATTLSCRAGWRGLSHLIHWRCAHCKDEDFKVRLRRPWRMKAARRRLTTRPLRFRPPWWLSLRLSTRSWNVEGASCLKKNISGRSSTMRGR